MYMAFISIKTSFLKVLGQRKPDCMGSLLWKGDINLKNGPCHLTKMAAMPIYCQTILIFLPFRNQKSHDLEIRHGLSGTQGLQSLYK